MNQTGVTVARIAYARRKRLSSIVKPLKGEFSFGEPGKSIEILPPWACMNRSTSAESRNHMCEGIPIIPTPSYCSDGIEDGCALTVSPPSQASDDSSFQNGISNGLSEEKESVKVYSEALPSWAAQEDTSLVKVDEGNETGVSSDKEHDFLSDGNSRSTPYEDPGHAFQRFPTPSFLSTRIPTPVGTFLEEKSSFGETDDGRKLADDTLESLLGSFSRGAFSPDNHTLPPSPRITPNLEAVPHSQVMKCPTTPSNAVSPHRRRRKSRLEVSPCRHKAATISPPAPDGVSGSRNHVPSSASTSQIVERGRGLMQLPSPLGSDRGNHRARRKEESRSDFFGSYVNLSNVRSNDELFAGYPESMLIQRQRIFTHVKDKLGKGQFGDVLLGELYPPIEETDNLSMFSPTDSNVHVLIPTEPAVDSLTSSRMATLCDSDPELPVYQQRYTGSTKAFYHSGVSQNASALLSQSLTSTLDASRNRFASPVARRGGFNFTCDTVEQTDDDDFLASCSSFPPDEVSLPPIPHPSTVKEKVLQLQLSEVGLDHPNPLLDDIVSVSGTPHGKVKATPSTRSITPTKQRGRMTDKLLPFARCRRKSVGREVSDMLTAITTTMSGSGVISLSRTTNFQNLVDHNFDRREPSSSRKGDGGKREHTPARLSERRKSAGVLRTKKVLEEEGSPPTTAGLLPSLTANDFAVTHQFSSPKQLLENSFVPSLSRSQITPNEPRRRPTFDATALAPSIGSLTPQTSESREGRGSHNVIPSIPSLNSESAKSDTRKADAEEVGVCLSLPFRSVAIKTVCKIDLHHPLRSKALHNEITMATHLYHKGLVNWFGVSEDALDVMLIMDLAEKGNLEQYIRTFGVHHCREMAPRFMADLVLALEYLQDGRQHPYDPNKKYGQGPLPTRSTLANGCSPSVIEDSIVLHRDLKPENLLLTWDYHIKIADFGAACFLGDTSKNGFAGTAPYVSPEMIAASKASKYSDLWSLGCVLFQMQEGHGPFNDKTDFLSMQRIKKYTSGSLVWSAEVSEEARSLVEGLLQVEPTKRLGADEQGGFSELKKHPFFKNINWKTVLDESNLTMTNATHELPNLQQHLSCDDLVLYSALVVILDDARFKTPVLLVLTDAPRFFIVDRKSNELILDLHWSSRVRVVVESAETFRMEEDGKTIYRFRDECRRADLWSERIAILNGGPRMTPYKSEARKRAKKRIK